MVSLITPSNTHNFISHLVSPIQMGTNLNLSTAAALEMMRKERFWGSKVLRKVRTRSGILCKESLESEFDGFDDENGWDGEGFDDIRDVNTRFDLSLSCLASCSPFQQCGSSSGGSVETVIQEDAWIEGILYRLENYRRFSFDASMQDDGHCIYDSSKVNDGQRASGSPDADLTATEPDSVVKSTRHEEIDLNDIKSRLQQMQLELSSSLCLLRSVKDEEKNHLSNGHKSSSSELQQLSDTWEFHENENYNVRDRLKSVCAELAVSQGKLASSIIDAQKLVKKKQRRIENGCRSLQHLRNICIIIHDSASEVLLAGSHDGWTTQVLRSCSFLGRKFHHFCENARNNVTRCNNERFLDKDIQLQRVFGLHISQFVENPLILTKYNVIFSSFSKNNTQCNVFPMYKFYFVSSYNLKASNFTLLVNCSFRQIIGYDAMQRKMERSEAGVFSLSLMLYPGRYEFKFIMDGVWRVDLLRPIVNNNGYENNVVIVPEWT